MVGVGSGSVTSSSGESALTPTHQLLLRTRWHTARNHIRDSRCGAVLRSVGYEVRPRPFTRHRMHSRERLELTRSTGRRLQRAPSIVSETVIEKRARINWGHPVAPSSSCSQ